MNSKQKGTKQLRKEKLISSKNSESEENKRKPVRIIEHYAEDGKKENYSYSINRSFEMFSSDSKDVSETYQRRVKDMTRAIDAIPKTSKAEYAVSLFGPTFKKLDEKRLTNNAIRSEESRKQLENKASRKTSAEREKESK